MSATPYRPCWNHRTFEPHRPVPRTKPHIRLLGVTLWPAKRWACEDHGFTGVGDTPGEAFNNMLQRRAEFANAMRKLRPIAQPIAPNHPPITQTSRASGTT